MKKVLFAAFGLLGLIAPQSFARGVSPYLPLNIDPSIERQIERVLILADKPVLTRPIAAATVFDALPVACQKDALPCEAVRRYLASYMRNWSVTEASIEASTSTGAEKTLPNRYGLTSGSDWEVTAQGYWQPSDYALLSLGAVAYEGEVVPEGTLLSFGVDRAQLDIGFRGRWLSPMSDSSMLLSTQAATMPSVTLSNYAPLTRWGFHYEAFVASMSESDLIQFEGKDNSGRPRLGGLHLSVEPASGWALGVNRLLQYGGGGRPGSLGDLFKAFFDPSGYDNTSADLSSDQQFGNQLASVTSQLLFPGSVPFSVYFEYAGEDTSYGKNYLLGNAALSGGIHFPLLWRRFDLTYEASEWQNLWYVNGVYGDGLRNKGHVIGHWAGDERVFQDAVGGQSHMLRVGWYPAFGGRFEMRYRTLQNETYSSIPYERAYDATFRYSRPLKSFTIGAEVFAGRNVFGEDFSRVAAFFRYDGAEGTLASLFASDAVVARDKTAELFVEAGVSAHRVKTDLTFTIPVSSQNTTAPHLAIGARRAVSDRSDLGARLELDDVDGNTLLGVRIIDYRYRFANPLALGVFVGAARYDLATPAYGLYVGAGVQWRDVLPGWDVALDARHVEKAARDRLLPEDPVDPKRPDSFDTIDSLSLSVVRRF
jgi:hypothetical protein